MLARIAAGIDRYAHTVGIDRLSARYPTGAAVLGWVSLVAMNVAIGQVETAILRPVVSLPFVVTAAPLILYPQFDSVFTPTEHVWGYGLLAVVIFVLSAVIVTPATREAWFVMPLVDAQLAAIYATLIAWGGSYDQGADHHISHPEGSD